MFKIVAVTLFIITLSTFGFFSIKNQQAKTEKAEQQAESLQTLITDLQTKVEDLSNDKEEYLKEKEDTKETIQAVPSQKALPQKVVSKPSVKVAKTEEPTIFSCVKFDDTIVEVTKVECDIIKQQNIRAEKVIDRYEDCKNKAKDDFQNNLDKITTTDMKVWERAMDRAGLNDERCENEKAKQLYEALGYLP